MRLRPILLLSIATMALAGQAMWVRPESIPVARVIKNTESRLSKNQQDGDAWFLLARVESHRYAFPEQQIEVYEPNEHNNNLYQPPTYSSILIEKPSERTPLTPGQQWSLNRSLRAFTKAINYQQDPAVAYLGLAWMMEQAARYPAKTVADGVTDKPLSEAEWKRRALATYRQAYKAAYQKDRAAEEAGIGVPQQFVSLEAGEAIIRLTGAGVGTLLPDEQKQIEELKAHIESLPKWITPIVFDVTGGNDLSSLLDSSKTVDFDLAGNEAGHKWPWVTEQTAFLVWDPEGSGKVTSGRQLFGTSTFWMFFADGFAALASLDDNGDGWLTGKELQGIAVWHDSDADAVSGSGEVKPVSDWGVKAIRCSYDGTVAAGLVSQGGLVFENGRRQALFDWMPRSK